MPVQTKKFEPDIPVQPGLELWHNDSEGRVLLTRLGEYGRKRDEMVPPNKDFHITPAERRVNQTAAATLEQDMFTNGTLRPVQLIPDEADTLTLLANPNNVTSDDLDGIFKLLGQNFQQRIDTITGLKTLERLITEAKDPQNKVLVDQYQMLIARRQAVVAETAIVEEPSVGGQRVPKAVTPH